MGDFPLVILANFLSAFAVTAIVTPFLIKRFKERGLTGIDMNKYSKPKVPEMGGIAVLFGFAFSVMVALGAYGFLGFNSLNLTALLAAFSTVLIVGLIGVFDDLIGWKKGIEQWQHALVPVFAALPLMVLPESIGFTELTIPFIGPVAFGTLYPLVIVPLAITGASNAANMLAGYNGLEAGMGSIISFTILAIVFFLPLDHAGKFEVMILMAGMLGALLSFLRFNWFPAKIFGGDSLTLMIGASIAAVAIIGNIEKIAMLLFAIYFAELVFKLGSRLKAECFGLPQKDGTLKAHPKGGSLTHWVLRRGINTEKQVVFAILGLQVIVSGLVFFLFWFKLFNLVG